MTSLFAKTSRSLWRYPLVPSSGRMTRNRQRLPLGLSLRRLHAENSRSAATRFSSRQETQAETSEALSCRAAVVEGHDPVEIFQNCLNKNTLTKPTAAVCLQAVDASNNMDAELGKATIQWLWNEHNNYISPDDNELTEVMVRLLVREGHERMIWDWISQSSEEDVTKLQSKIQRYRWRRFSMKYLCKAKADLSQHQSLDDALETFFEAIQRPVDIPLHDASYFLRHSLETPFRSSRSESARGTRSKAHDIWRSRYPNTSLGFWIKFYHGISTANGNLCWTVESQARMLLMHPKRPDPFPMMHILREIEQDPNHGVRKIIRPATRSVWFNACELTSYLLQEMGHPIEADWVLSVAKPLFSNHPTKLIDKSGTKSPPRWVSTKSRSHPWQR